MYSLRPLGAALCFALAGASRAFAQDAAPGAPPPLTLSDVLGRAIAQHPLVDAARARVRSAEAARLTARLLANPTVTYQVENAPWPGRTLAGVDREVSTFATLPLEPLFQRWPRVRAVDADVRAARAELDLARRAVSLSAARAFYRVALAQAAVSGSTDVRDRLAELLTYTQTRVKEGVTSEGDLIRVQVELDRAEAELALEAAELARARGELAPYLGPATVMTSGDAPEAAPVRVVVEATGPASGITGAPIELAPRAVYLARARASRPDLLAARARVDAARAQVSYQRSLSVRQVGATFGAKRIGEVNTLIAGLTVPLPIFDQNRGEVQRATAEVTAAQQELAWRERLVFAEVAAAHEAARLLAERRGRFADSLLARAEESRRITLVAYREGAASLLQVLDVSRTLGDVRLTVYRSVIAERETRLELDIISGSELSAGSSPNTTMFLDPSTGSRPSARDGGRP